jgi:hypothetical protein
MNINKLLKISLIFLIIAIVIFNAGTKVFGWNADWTQFDNKDAGNASKAITNVAGALINIVSIVAAAIAIIMLIALGIKYVSSGVSGKAEVKKNIAGYVTGAVILFAASGILKLIQMFVDGNINNI